MTTPGFAPAKVNLYLHVAPLGADGFHPLESWMVFADIGDQVSLQPFAAYGLTVEGPFAASTPGGSDNLVLRARDAAMANAPGKVARFGLTLEKNLPPASGLGGGSSDAAATLRLMGDYLGLPAERLASLAAGLGSDVPACLIAHSLIARGRGEQLSIAPAAPPLDAVLVNPGVETSTARVFAAFDQASPSGPLESLTPVHMSTVQEVADFLGRQRNDLQTAACRLHPEIVEALDVLARSPESLLARMSGSGATCFALCPDSQAAKGLAHRLAQDHPAWWVRACPLG